MTGAGPRPLVGCEFPGLGAGVTAGDPVAADDQHPPVVEQTRPRGSERFSFHRPAGDHAPVFGSNTSAVSWSRCRGFEAPAGNEDAAVL